MASRRNKEKESLIFVTRKAHFNAAHRLHNPGKSEDWNKQTFGKCNHKNWHGHNYILRVTVAGIPDEDTGYVIDLSKLNSIICAHILDPCDHKNLNLDVPFLQGLLPSTENLVRAFFQELEGPVWKATGGSGFLYEVDLQETEKNSAKFSPYLLNKEFPVVD